MSEPLVIPMPELAAVLAHQSCCPECQESLAVVVTPPAEFDVARRRKAGLSVLGGGRRD